MQCHRTLFAIALALAVGCTGTMTVTDGPEEDDDAPPMMNDAAPPAADGAAPAAADAFAPPSEDAGETVEPDMFVLPDPPSTIVAVDGIVAIEGESYIRMENTEHREWVRFDESSSPDISPDPDPPHLEGASGGAYLEALPDTRVTHDDPLVSGESFHGSGGTGPMLTYPVRFETAGRYVVWVRAYSTGGEDNGLHIGIDGDFPEESARVQFCSGKNRWTWSSAQRRSSNHCGSPRTVFLTVDTPGEHEVHFSMREDGFELDKVLLVLDESFEPSGAGPDEVWE